MTPFFVYIAIGIVVAVAVNKLFVKNFPKQLRTAARIVTVFLFVVASAAIFLCDFAEYKTDQFIEENVVLLERFIIKNSPNAKLLKEGYDISSAQKALKELERIVPSKIPGDYGIFSVVADAAYGYLLKSSFDFLREKDAEFFKDFLDNGRISASSALNGVKNSILSRFDRVVLYIRLVVLFVLFIYAAYCAHTAFEEKKAQKEANEPIS
ncbi:MAG: hypothetical protein LBQ18_05065 [Campylobacteraceae bacterium]|jgi:hypothetical protein|nr:hypothetical protein [Campylobacteraceae bacterium]